LTLYRIKKFGGFAPKNLCSGKKVEKHVYNAIYDLLSKLHSKLVIVALTKELKA